MMTAKKPMTEKMTSAGTTYATASWSRLERMTGFELLPDQRRSVGVVGVMRELLARSPQLLYVHPDVDVRPTTDFVVRRNPNLCALGDLLPDRWSTRQVSEPILQAALALRVASVSGVRGRVLRDLDVLGGDDRDALTEAVIEGWVER